MVANDLTLYGGNYGDGFHLSVSPPGGLADLQFGLDMPSIFNNIGLPTVNYPVLNDGNFHPLPLGGTIVEEQLESALGLPDFDIGNNADGSIVIQQAQAPPALLAAPSFPCTQLGCTRSFQRDSDRTRHQNTVHSARQGLHLCPVPGCPKSYGTGYSRTDKVTEHLWKKHGDRGYTKRVL